MLEPATTVNKETSLADETERIFREEFPKHIDGFEPREQQIKMARTVADGLENGENVLAEAGTGTGKSWAVLVPSVLYAQKTGRPVVISTGTIALQEQYILNDIPMLKNVMPKDFSIALAKGKRNFLCKLKLDDVLTQPELDGISTNDPLLEWAQETKTGDIAHYEKEPDPSLWSRLQVDDTCIGRTCPWYDECHYYDAKEAIKSVEIIVCNHHLFFADVQIKEATDGYGEIIPNAAAYVFDEAHHLESIARDSLGTKLTQQQLPYWTRQVRQLPALIDPQMWDQLDKANQLLFQTVSSVMGEDRQLLPEVPKQAIRPVIDLQKEIVEQLKIEKTDFEETKREQANNLIENAAEFQHTLHRLFGLEENKDEEIDAEEESNHIVWAEREWRGDRPRITIHETPVDVSPILKRRIFNLGKAVLTSATISANKSFKHIRSRLGIEHAQELIVDSPFDYKSNCLLMVPPPRTLPNPQNNPNYHAEIAPIIEEVLMRTKGRAFCLFTSYRGMQATYDILKYRLPFPVLKQGDEPRSRLLDQFKKLPGSVLFATKTFWEGVSVEGEELSCVIIDRLPFSVPSDPISKAIQEKAIAKGENPFFTLSVPEAILHIKQGFGRLIRRKDDRGIVVILDKRIRTKGYGKAFLDSLPDARRVENMSDIQAFFE